MVTSKKKLQLDTLLKSNEWWPTNNDINWKTIKINNIDVQILTKMKGMTEFKINNNMKNSMNHFNNIKKDINYKLDISSTATKAKIYIIKDVKTNKFVIGYTSADVMTSVKLSISNLYLGKYSILYNLEAPLSELNLQVNILEVVNSKSRKIFTFL